MNTDSILALNNITSWADLETHLQKMAMTMWNSHCLQSSGFGMSIAASTLRQLDRFRKDIFTEFFARSQASQDLFKQPLGYELVETFRMCLGCVLHWILLVRIYIYI